MRIGIRSSLNTLGLLLALGGNLFAQHPDQDPQRITLARLRKFAVYARVQLSHEATLQRIDENLLRARIESALRREGIAIDSGKDVRDGSQASVDLLYLVMETKDQTGQTIGFAASSCLQASQMVRIPRLTTPKRIAYAVVPTWHSCGLLVGDSASYGATILQNADEQIIRFIDAWRFANAPPPDPSFPGLPELGMVGARVKERTSK
jgi:hypothetical protein